jgi:multidrug efflux pump subunit AcrA (membrane-fusion protein)
MSWRRKNRLGLLVFSGLLIIAAAEAHAIEVDGVMEPHRVIKIGGSGTPGILDYVDVDRGDVVKKGQTLAMLQSGVEKAGMEIARARAEEEANIRIQVEKASLEIARARAGIDAVIKARRAELDLAIRKEKRNEELFKKEFVPFAEMDEAETKRMLAEAQLEEAVVNKRLAELDHKRAEAQVEAAVVNQRLAQLEYERSKEVVKRMTIVSPVDGVVVERYLSSGEYVEEQPILKLAQINPLNVEIILPVSMYRSVRMDMVAKVVPEAPLSGSYTAKVKVIDKVVDAASGTFGVRLELANPNNTLPGGLKCKVRLPFD